MVVAGERPAEPNPEDGALAVELADEHLLRARPALRAVVQVLVNHADVEAVIITTPHRFHARQALAALSRQTQLP